MERYRRRGKYSGDRVAGVLYANIAEVRVKIVAQKYCCRARIDIDNGSVEPEITAPLRLLACWGEDIGERDCGSDIGRCYDREQEEKQPTEHCGGLDRPGVRSGTL